MKKNYFLIIAFGFLISCSENKKQIVDFSIVIHGGAGTMEREKMSIEKELEYKKTLEEALNELSFLVVGAYGKNLHKQFGAPLRLHLPWKYGFKSIKSIVSLRFTAERPVSFWETLASNEYGF